MSNSPLASALLAATLLAALAAPSALAADGAALYREHCRKCHGDDGRANTLRGWLLFAQNLSRSKWQAATSDAQILEAIEQGPGRMPAYADKLTPDERQALLQAVRGLAQ